MPGTPCLADFQCHSFSPYVSIIPRHLGICTSFTTVLNKSSPGPALFDARWSGTVRTAGFLGLDQAEFENDRSRVVWLPNTTGL
jgi:hypothetical protein